EVDISGKVAGKDALLVAWISQAANPFPHSLLETEADKLHSQLQCLSVSLISVLDCECLERAENRHPLGGTFVPLLFAFRFVGRSVGDHARAAISPPPGTAGIDATLQRIVSVVFDMDGRPLESLAEESRVIEPARVLVTLIPVEECQSQLAID